VDNFFVYKIEMNRAAYLIIARLLLQLIYVNLSMIALYLI